MIITLLTDFGTKDAYVGMMKGVILSVNPDAKIVDISHEVDPQDIVQATYLIQSSYLYFPKNTVHLIVVDPDVGSQRKIIAVKADGHIFLAPDNGVLALVLQYAAIEMIVQVDNPDFMLEPISHTFHGRDIFAPVAAYLSKGTNITEIGSIITPEDLIVFTISEPQSTSNGNLSGAFITIDRFGNLVTNIGEEALTRNFPGVSKELLILEINGRLIYGVSDYYSSVPKNAGLALIGSGGYLEISVNCGNAQVFYDVKKGDQINIFVKQ